MGHPDGKTSPNLSFARRGERRGSVLVLVMTLLSILFVIGVAFLATMNFEADSIASEKLRAQNQSGTDAVTGAMGQVLVNGFMADDQVPFGDESVGSSVTGFAALPGWHDTTSPIEPYQTERIDPVTGASFPVTVFPWMTDPQGMSKTPFAGPTFLGASINTEWVDGEAQTVTVLTRVCVGGINEGNPCVNDAGCPGFNTAPGVPPGTPATCSGYVCDGGANAGRLCDPTLPVATECPPIFGGPVPTCAPLVPTDFQRVCPAGVNEGMPCYTDGNCGCTGPTCPIEERCFVCIGGKNHGKTCDAGNPGDCPDGGCGQPIVPVDADGDGVVDTIQVNAKSMGFSEAQLAEISSVVNPPTKKNGKVFIGLRIVPHGGMVSLNDSHPKLIETALHVPSVLDPNTSEFGNFYHRPTLAETFEAYSPASEETGLRRRGGLIASRKIPPSRLLGNGLPGLSAAVIARPNRNGDMPEQLLPFVLKTQEFESPAELLADGRPGHRFWPFQPRPDKRNVNLMVFEEAIPGTGDPSLWRSRMEPFTAREVAQGTGRIPTVLEPSYDYREYDKRHLATTISHDDLLRRGGTVYTPTGMKDVREAMIEANWTNPNACADAALYPHLPFEYADYPTDLPNATKPDLDGTGEVCDCPSSTACTPDRRKGRLQLSLAWLDYAFDPMQSLIQAETRNRIIYDAFMLLLNNASGAAWDGKCRYTAPGQLGGDCLPWEECRSVCLGAPGTCGDQGECVDLVLNQPHRLAMISRTAASLTANMIDYMDVDERTGIPDAYIPTRIALRSFDFSEGAMCVGGVRNGRFCPNGPEDCQDPLRSPAPHPDDGECRPATAVCLGGGNDGGPCPHGNVDCPDGRCVTPLVGRDFNFRNLIGPTPMPVYVYGLERQPFITEVVTGYNQTATIDARGVELFNPFEVALNLSDYYIVEADNTGVVQNRVRLPLGSSIAAGRFLTFVSDGTGNAVLGALAGTTTTDGSFWAQRFDGASAFQFKKGWQLYLVRSVDYENPDKSISTPDIVVDQFAVDHVGDEPITPAASLIAPYFQSEERPSSSARPWSAPVPQTGWNDLTNGVSAHTLAQSNTFAADATSATTHNVELFFADTRTFTQPKDPSPSVLDYSTAFATTGSMLLLPRHANRSLDDLSLGRGDGAFTGALSSSDPNRLAALRNLAFTWWLDRSYTAFAINPATNFQVIQASILEREQVDNGRMPIFDIGTAGVPLPGTAGPTFYSAHHVPARDTAEGKSTTGRPGDVAHLPWGQLVFDYFTALPLRSLGPYRTEDLSARALPEAQPRVDLGGLRVHGRIDLNAAPWTVLRGLPLIPMSWLPTAIRGPVESALFPQYYDATAGARVPLIGGPPLGQELAGTLLDERAQGIVAYRETREAFPPAIVGTVTGTGTAAETGNYSQPLAGRSWTDVDPAFRRGMGFLTVGELANVRFDDPSRSPPLANGPYRMDGGVVLRDITVVTTPPYAASNHDYLNAAATLIALGDWVTVRSQVSTVYGVIRGEEDDTIVDPKPERQSRLRRQDLQARSLRFQETLDRLPTFLGAQRPARIGERVIGKYQDFQND